MPSQEIDVKATTRASPETVYALLRDGATWPEWSPLGSYELEESGENQSEGVGAVRMFRTGWIRSREQIVELVPGRRLSYVLLSGLPIRNYRADVDLEPTGDGTLIHWHSSFDPKIPGTGWLYRRQLGRFIERLVNGLAERAQKEK
jgi:uncharacterized protein YndB with AHSA1/START domain